MGLIWGALSGLGEGLADAGNSMSRFAMMEEERRQRALEREQLLRERLDSNKELALLRGGGSGGGFQPPSALTPGSLQEEHIAAQTGVDVPTLNAGRSGLKTGDWREFGKATGTAQDVDRFSLKTDTDMMGSSPDAVLENPEAFTNKTTRTEFTPEHEEAKQQFLEKYARASGGLVYGSSYKSVADGQDKAFETNQKQKIVEGADPTRFSEAQASEKGKRFENMSDSGSMNTSTGATTLNKLGEAKVRDENASADARKAKADPGAPGKVPRLQSTKEIDGRTVAVMSDGTTRDLGPSQAHAKTVASLITKRESEDGKFKKLSEKEKKDWALERLALGSGAQPTSGDNTGIVNSDLPKPKTKAEMQSLKPGTKYVAPDGSVRIR